MTSIERSNSKYVWAAFAQLGVIAHTMLLAVYATQGQYLFAGIVMLVIGILSWYAISLAWQAGALWPTGRMEDD